MAVTLVGATILVAVVLGSAFELGLLGASSGGTPSFDVKQLVGHSLLGRYLNDSTAPSPVGIASYGLHNDSGSVRPYAIDTSEVVGQASIMALSTTTTWNDSAFPGYLFLECDHCASLQMNVYVLVETARGNQSLWVQNVAEFSDTAQQVAGGLIGQIWNQTTPNANISADASGNGAIVGGQLGGVTTTCYCFGYLGARAGLYSFPLDITLKTLVQIPENHSGIEITMVGTPFGGYDYGLTPPANATAYLPVSDVTSASIVVSPYATISFAPHPLRGNYDAELVWGGYCCGQIANFIDMNSNLSLSYQNSQGHLVLFPSFYTFGAATSEMAVNLNASPAQFGAHVVLGKNNNTILGY